MNEIQTDLSEQALIMAIRANLCDFYRYLSRSLEERGSPDERFTCWCTSLAHPWFNGVLSSRAALEGDETFIEQTLEYFRSKHVGAFTWWMEPNLKPSDWEPVLSAYDFRFSDDTPGMAADLRGLNESTQTIDGLKVRAVTDEETLHTWAHVFTRGYGLPADWETSVYDLWLKLGLDLPIRNYIGFLNGQAVATSSLYLGGGAAGIYSVSTLKQARGKGIGAASVLQPLQEAREIGYHIGVLQSSDMGYNVYKKLGFRHLCQIEYFYRTLH